MRARAVTTPLVVRADVAVFFRRLRAELGGNPFPYLWTAEWHKSGHGLHVHFAVGRYVKRSVINAAWGRGFVHIKLLGDLPVGAGAWEEARKAAGYLAKYVGKAFSEERIPGLHRYEVAQGFQPEIVQVWGRSVEDAIDRACELFSRHHHRIHMRDWHVQLSPSATFEVTFPDGLGRTSEPPGRLRLGNDPPGKPG